MKIKALMSMALFAIAIFLFAGCMTPVSVQTDPPGATIYCRGSGRPSYQWKPRGVTAPDKPVEFRVPYNAILTYAVWPAADGKTGSRSSVTRTSLLFEDDVEILIKRQ